MNAVTRRLLGDGLVARWRVWTVVAAAGATGLLVVAQAALLARLLAGGIDGSTAGVLLVGGLVAIALLRAALAWLRHAVAAQAAAQLKAALRRRTLRQVDQLGPAWLSTRKPGELVTLLSKGLDALDPYLVSYLPQLVTATVVPLTVVVWLTATDVASGLTVLVTLPLLPIFGVLVGRHTKVATARQWRELGRLGGHFLDTLRGLRTLQAFGRATAQAEVVRRVADRNRNATMGTLRIAFLSGLVLELVATLSVALVAVPLGIRLLDGEVTFADALLVLILAPEAYLPLRTLGAKFHAAAEGLTIAEQVFAVVDQEIGARRTPAAHALPPDERLTIEFDSVGLRYPERSQAALADVSLRVRAGERVALVGPTGAGKSSLLSLLLGLAHPTAGRILVGGQDLTRLDIEEWRRSLAWLPQRPHLFAATVADNIRLGRADASDAEVARAAEAAGAAEFIDGLGSGYGTLLGEHGVRLSAGQRQRVALARVFLRDAPVVLLDEPTARLDGHSEAVILAATRRLMADRTVLAITHRPALLSVVDTVAYLRDGVLDGARPAAAGATPATALAGVR